MLTPQANLAIVGSSRATKENAPYHDGITEIWAFNSGAMSMQRIDVAFQIHTRESIAEESKKYNLWLRSCGIPIYMKNKYDDIPSSVAFPYEEVLALTDHVRLHGKRLEYFTSTPSLSIGLAILQNRPKIQFYGIGLVANPAEYKYQRECFAFWTGYAAGRGIELEINCADDIFDKPIYGKG